MKRPDIAGSLAWGSPGSVIVAIVAGATVGVGTVLDFTWTGALATLTFALLTVATGRAYLATRRQEEITGRRKP